MTMKGPMAAATLTRTERARRTRRAGENEDQITPPPAETESNFKLDRLVLIRSDG